MTTEPALFPAPPTPKLTLSAHFANYRGKATYAAYKVVKRVQCEECVWVLHEARGKGEPPRSGRVKRTEAGVSTVLCTGHADLWKKRDGAK